MSGPLSRRIRSRVLERAGAPATTRFARGLGAAAASLIAATAWTADRVELRSGEVVEGRIVSVDAGGVAMTRSGDRARTGAGAEAGDAVDRYGWDRIARLDADAGAAAWPGVDRWLGEGERLWRARVRLARGDGRLAAEAIDRSSLELAGDGPTAMTRALVALQLALTAGDRPAALAAALEAIRLRRRGLDDPTLAEWIEPSASGAFVRRPLLDGAMALSPLVPPIVASEPERLAMLAVLERFDARGDAGLDEMHRRFMLALDPSRPAPAATPAPRSADRGAEDDLQRSLDFIRALRDAQSEDAEERRRGRDALAQLRRRLPEWCEAWARVAVGRGLLRDDTPESRRAAQLELLHLPARFAESQPWLAGYAAALASAASRSDGFDDEAQRLAPAADAGAGVDSAIDPPSPPPTPGVPTR